MRAEGNIEYFDLPKDYMFSKRLSDDMIEKGDVYKVELNHDYSSVSLSILFVAPLSGVKMHTHTVDSEWYFNTNADRAKDERIEFCEMGGSHELVNTSKTKWLVVVSVKIPIM